MKTIIGILISFILFAPVTFAAEIEKPAPTGEAGVFFPGRFAGVAGAADGSVYLLARDHRVIKIAPDGQQQIIKLPAIAEAKEDDYLCDIAADDKNLAFCGYPFSGIFVLDLSKPEKFDFIPLTVDGQPLNIMMIARKGDGWCVKDADERVLHVAADRSISHLPKFSELESDKYGKAVIVPPPADHGDKIVYPGNALREDGTPMWIAPASSAPREIMSLEYLGYDAAQRDMFMVTTASGELDAETTLYAVQHSQIVASRKIPGSDAEGVMRYCRLSPDGSILLIQADPNGQEGIYLKRLKLESTQPGAG